MTDDFKFFWVSEESEIYAARNLEELNAGLGFPGQDAVLEPALCAANKGENWDEVSDEETLDLEPQEDEEDGRTLTCRAALKEWYGEHLDEVVQIGTAYN